MTIILSNLNQLKKFTGKFLRKFIVKWILKLSPHLEYVATLPRETIMSAKQAAINDKLQVLRYNGVVSNQIKKGFFAESVHEIFFNCLAKLQARAWLSHALYTPGLHTAKTKKVQETVTFLLGRYLITTGH